MKDIIMRKLASIRIANAVTPIPQADAIEAVRVDAWTCVSKKGEFEIGSKGVYFEIDSFLPAEDKRFQFLEKQFIQFNDKIGARLRTIRLRGQLSQGLFLPLSVFPELNGKEVGEDVTEILKIEKWEPIVPAQLSGEIKGGFPSRIKKTDQERVQNLIQEINENSGKEFEVTIKLDGSSMTVFKDQNEFGVCGRNWELRETEGNTLWAVTRRNKIFEALESLNRNLAFQGEIIGEGIQGNPEKIKGQEFFMFDIFDIDKSVYLNPIERQEILKSLNEKGFKIKHVPILDNLILNHDVDELLKLADGQSLNKNEKREGLVFKRLDGKFSFKTISNWYLEKHKDR
jgi:RNA ligase (TIGR02306 family)